MSATSSIDGLVSGLNTTQIIDQLMQVAAQPQTNLKNQVSTEQTTVSALQKVNSALAAVATKAGDLSQMSGWTPSTATSSNDNVTVQADAGAAVGSLSFTIGGLASASRSTYSQTGALTDKVMAAGVDYSIDFTDTSRAPVTISTGDGTLQSVAAALNASGTGVHAALVKNGSTNASGDPEYTLQVTDGTTGAGSGFTIDPVSSGDPAFMGTATTTSGADASITVNGTALTSSTNTFTALMPGVDVTLGAQATKNSSATITISRDASGMASKVQDLVDAANSALDTIGKQTAYDASTQMSSPLTGDSTVTGLKDRVLSAVTDGVNGKSLATVGIQVDRTGRITFDADKFQQAYEADPTGTAALFAGSATWSDPSTDVTLQSSTWRTQPGSYSVVADGSGGTIDGQAATQTGSLLTGAEGSPVEGLTVKYSGSVNGTVTYTRGIAAKLEAIAQRASNSTDGTVTTDIQGHNSSIKRMQSDISGWDVRLQDQRTALEQQYTNLETTLGKLKDQGSWLASQIASLPNISSTTSSSSSGG